MKKPIIKCPNCGAEYLPAEIFLPMDFFGRPQNVIKGVNGNILGYDGDDMDLKEQYECDYCGKTFTVSASVAFKAEVVRDIFDEDDFVIKTKEGE